MVSDESCDERKKAHSARIRCEQGVSAYRPVMNVSKRNNRFSATCHRIQVPWIDTDTNKDVNKARND